jgi:hypothetical protein
MATISSRLSTGGPHNQAAPRLTGDAGGRRPMLVGAQPVPSGQEALMERNASWLGR